MPTSKWYPPSDEDGDKKTPNWFTPDTAGAHTGAPLPTSWNPAASRAEALRNAPEPLDPTGADRGVWRPEAFVAPGPTRRVNVNFSDQAFRTLEELALRSGKSMSEILREAIALKAWFDGERAEGSKILVERPNGQIREVISV